MKILEYESFPPPRAKRADAIDKRSFISAVLARNEVDRDHAYNRRLFLRLPTGHYQFNPTLALRENRQDGAAWVSVFSILNLPLIKLTGNRRHAALIGKLLDAAGPPP